ncbi:OPT oligopeptide transporter protein-domain-containing protein [Cladochytrium replicatum]|nr:OPT oligopeptide transporter protein-domain-containing protein [Cladochytrium replicatum]
MAQTTATDLPPLLDHHTELVKQRGEVNQSENEREPSTEVDPIDVEAGPQEWSEFTWRSAIVGSLLGCVVAASNFYLGFKVGWTFGASIFAAVFTFGILKPLSRLLPLALGGRYFGPRENVTAQTAASTSGGLSVGMITAIPALYRLGLMSDDVMDDILRLTMWTICASSYGMFFAVPLRKLFVVKVDLPFPTPRATATTIKILHSTASGEKNAMASVKLMLCAFSLSTATSLISYWVYIFEKVHVVYWVGKAVGSAYLQTADATWGWFFAPNFAFYGAGFITPPNILLSFLLGSVVAFGIGGPTMLNSGYLVSALGWGKSGNGSAQSWWFWPGIALMLFTAFAELAVNWRLLATAGGGVIRQFISSIQTAAKRLRRRGRGESSEALVVDGTVSDDETSTAAKNKEIIDDPVPPELQIPTLWWTSGLLVSIVLTCFVMGFFFGIPVYQSLLSIVFAFLLSLVGIIAAGQTDINPISTLAKVVQVTFAKMPANSLEDLQRADLLCAAVTSSAANQSVDMIADLKTGHLVGASPRSQFLAQLVGTGFAIVTNVLFFVLFAKAYPCIVKVEETCEFGLSPILGWQNVTLLLTKSTFIPPSSVYTAIVCAVVSVVYVFVKTYYIPEKLHYLLPNLNAIGLGFIVPQPSTPLAMVMAMVGSQVWKRIHPKSHESFHVAVASGAIAGVGITAVIRAAMKLANVPDRLVTFNCPVDAMGKIACVI